MEILSTSTSDDTIEHRKDIAYYIGKGKSKTTFGSHIGHYFRQNRPTSASKPSDKMIGMAFKVDVLWQGNPISCMKSFKRYDCRLCMKEKFEIYKAQRDNPEKLINQNTELYGGCRHHPTFHRFLNNNPGTDEADDAEKSHEQPKLLCMRANV